MQKQYRVKYCLHLRNNLQMKTLKNYSEIFKKALNINDETFEESIEYNQIDEWDSIGHMTLISEIESVFDITFETDDIIEFSSFDKGGEILKKYKIEI